MPHRYCLPTPYHGVLRRATLVALLLAGGSGIGWDVYFHSHTQLGGYNEQMDVVQDALLSKAVGARADNRGGNMASGLMQTANVSRGFNADASPTGEVLSSQ